MSKIKPKIVQAAAIIDELLVRLTGYNNVLSWFNLEEIKNENTTELQMLRFLHIYEAKAHDLEALKVALKQVGVLELANLLEDTETDAAHLCFSKEILPFKPNFNPKLNKIIKELRSFYKSSFRSFRPMPYTAATSINVNEIWVDLHMKDSLTGSIETDLIKSLSTAFDHSSLVFITGKPGIGKTTLVRQLCYNWAIGKLPEYDLVLCARLRDYQKSQSMLDITVKWIMRYLPYAPLDDILQSIGTLTSKMRDTDSPDMNCHTLIIFDGLDESRVVCSELEHYISSRESVCLPFSVLITTRPYGAHDIQTPHVHLIIDGFDDLQQKQYIKQHFFHNLESAEMVIARLEHNPKLKKLARIPLLLSFICIANAQLEKNNATELCECVCKFMIDRCVQDGKIDKATFGSDWKSSSLIQKLGQLALSGLLTENIPCKSEFVLEDLKKVGLSFSTFETHTNVKETELVCLIGFLNKHLIHNFKTGWIAVYSFWHKILLEFFAALHLNCELKMLPKIPQSSRPKKSKRKSKLAICFANRPDFHSSSSLLTTMNHFNHWQLLGLYHFVEQLSSNCLSNTEDFLLLVHPLFQIVNPATIMSSVDYRLSGSLLGCSKQYIFNTRTTLLGAQSPATFLEFALDTEEYYVQIDSNCWYFSNNQLLLFCQPTGPMLQQIGQQSLLRRSQSQPDGEIRQVNTCIVSVDCWSEFVKTLQKHKIVFVSQLSVFLTSEAVNLENVRQLDDKNAQKVLVSRMTVGLEKGCDSYNAMKWVERMFFHVKVSHWVSVIGNEKQSDGRLLHVLASGVKSSTVVSFNFITLPLTCDDLINFQNQLGETKVAVLKIDNCNLNSDTMICVAEMVKRFQLRECYFCSEPVLRHQETFQKVCHILKSMTGLQKLGLCGNVLTTESVSFLIEQILPKMPTLETLVLANNWITKEDYEKLRKAFSQLVVSL